MTIKGVLWHSTGANNPTLKRYVQPSDTKPTADTYSKAKWLEVLGTNTNKNDWNHIDREAGLNYWIGKLADGTVAAVQTMPDNYRPWGCGSSSKGSCNDGWIQFEICEDALTDKTYFNAAYKEACELTAYLCKTHNLNPTGTTTHKGVTVPVILCHADSYNLGLGSNHGDVLHWFKKHGKTMADVRTDVAKLLNGGSSSTTTTTTKTSKVDVTYQVWDDIKNAWLPNVTNDSDYAGILGNSVCAVYANLAQGSCVYKVHTLDNKKWLPEVKDRTDYAGIFNQSIDAFMIKSTDANVKIHYQVHTKGGKWLSYVSGYSTSDSTNGYAGILGSAIDGIRMYAEKTTTTTTPTTTTTTTVKEEVKEETVQKIYRIRKSWADVKSQTGAYANLNSAKEKCQASGEGYKVFDWNGKEVYAYVAPKVEPVPEQKPVEPTPQPEKEKVDVAPTPETTETDVKKDVTTPVEPETKEEENPKVEPEVQPEVSPDVQDDNTVTPETDTEVTPDNTDITHDEDDNDDEKINTLLDVLTKIITFILNLFIKK